VSTREASYVTASPLDDRDNLVRFNKLVDIPIDPIDVNANDVSARSW
jgi:hypothetical protein